MSMNYLIKSFYGRVENVSLKVDDANTNPQKALAMPFPECANISRSDQGSSSYGNFHF